MNATKENNKRKFFTRDASKSTSIVLVILRGNTLRAMPLPRARKSPRKPNVSSLFYFMLHELTQQTVLDQIKVGRQRLKDNIISYMDISVVAYMRVDYLDLAIRRYDYPAFIRRRSYDLFLDGHRFCKKTAERADPNFVEAFMVNRHVLRSMLKTRSHYLTFKSLVSLCFEYVDTVDYAFHTLYRIGFLFKVDRIMKKFDVGCEYREQKRSVLDKLMRLHNDCHGCAMRYLRLFYYGTTLLLEFLGDIKERSVLEFFLQRSYEAGVDLWGPRSIGSSSYNPLLYFMSVQRYDLVHTLIDYGYSMRKINRKEKDELISGAFGTYPVGEIPSMRLHMLFDDRPEKMAMILYALWHCASPRDPGFLQAYDRLYRSLDFPLYPTEYLRCYLKKIVGPSLHRMVDERCRVYQTCRLVKTLQYLPRSLKDLALCAFREELKGMRCPLPTAISRLMLPVELKDWVALKSC